MSYRFTTSEVVSSLLLPPVAGYGQAQLVTSNYQPNNIQGQPLTTTHSVFWARRLQLPY